MDYINLLSNLSVTYSTIFLELVPQYKKVAIGDNKYHYIKEHCEYTSLRIALLVSPEYGFGMIEGGLLPNKNICDLLLRLCDDYDALFTINSFGNDNSGHSFSIVRCKGVLYKIESWYYKFEQRWEEITVAQAVKYISKFKDHLLWYSTCINCDLKELSSNCKMLRNIAWKLS